MEKIIKIIDKSLGTAVVACMLVLLLKNVVQLVFSVN